MKLLTYKVGCLINALGAGEINAGAQQCNASNRMRSGIAPLLADAWPQIRRADQNLSSYLTPAQILGRYSSCELSDGVTFYNLYGQLHWSQSKVEPTRNTNYAKLAQALQLMTDDLLAKHEASECHVGIPLIGCGLAGGDWDIVQKLVHDTLVVAGIRVTVYVLTESVLRKLTKPTDGLFSSR